MRGLAPQSSPLSSSPVFVDVDDTEHEARQDETDNRDIVAHTEINPRNGDSEYQGDCLTQLNIAPRPPKVPGISLL